MTVVTLLGAALTGVRLLDDVPEPEDVRPGWFALIVVLTLVVVTVLLWRSMRTQLGKIDFDDSDGTGAAEPQPEQADGGETDGERREP